MESYLKIASSAIPLAIKVVVYHFSVAIVLSDSGVALRGSPDAMSDNATNFLHFSPNTTSLVFEDSNNVCDNVLQLPLAVSSANVIYSFPYIDVTSNYAL